MKRIVFVILIASLLLAGCTPKEGALQEWRDVVVEKDLELLPEEYTKSGLDIISEWAEEACTEVMMEEIGEDDETTILTRCQGVEDVGGVEVAVSDFVAMSAVSITPIPFDDVIKVKWLKAGEAKKIIAVFLLATSASVYWAHTDPQHNPNLKNTQARNNILALMTAWNVAVTGGSPENNPFKCAVVHIVNATDNVVRYVIWVADSTRVTGGYLAWFRVVKNDNAPWGGSYDITQTDFEKGPSRTMLEKKGWEWKTISCKDLPGLPPLQGAQP